MTSPILTSTLLPGGSVSQQVSDAEEKIGDITLWETGLLPHGSDRLPTVTTCHEKPPNISTIAGDSTSVLMHRGPLRTVPVPVSESASVSNGNQTAARHLGQDISLPPKFLSSESLSATTLPISQPHTFNSPHTSAVPATSLIEVLIPTRSGRKENGFTTGTAAVTDFLSRMRASDNNTQALSSTFHQSTRAHTDIASSASVPHRKSRLTHSRKAKIGITSTTYTNVNSNSAPKTSQAQLSQVAVDMLLDTQVAPITISLAPDNNTRMLDTSSTLEHDTFSAGARRVKLNTRFCRTMQGADSEARIMGRRETVYAHPYETRNQMFLHKLERMFGVGSLDRGNGPKPPRHRRINGFAAADNILRKTNTIVSVNSPLSATSGSISASTIRSRSPDSMSAQDFASTGASSVDEDMNMEDAFEKVGGLLDEIKERQNKIDTAPTRDVVDAWVATVQKLLKGKVRMGREDIKAIDKVIDDIVEAEDYVELTMLKNTQLWESMTRLVLMDEIPFDDEFNLKAGAQGIVKHWRSKYALELTLEGAAVI